MPSRSVSLAVLLPPSEGKAEGGCGPAWSATDGVFGEALGKQRVQVVKALAQARGGNQQLLGVGGALLTRAQSANTALLGAPTLPAAERYTGVVWDHIGLRTLTAAARRRAATSVIVVSGLHGLLSLDDPIPDYRLKTGASLKPMGKLSTWWRGPLSAVLNDHLRDRYVVDLLPHEHRAAWVPHGVRGVSVTFVERDGKVAGHDAKAAKGRLVRHLLVTGGRPAAALASWTDARFDLLLSPLGG